jgi:tetratricopeptide (TPR) repeat protein
MRFARWDDILALPAPGESLRGLTIFWHFARGCAFVAKGAVRQAHVERALLEEAYDGLNEGQRFGMLGSWTPLHELAIQALDARIATAHGDLTTAIRNWRTAVSEQDKLEHDGFYRELPIWYYPVRESLGALLLRNGYAAEAEKIFREDLSRNPHNPRSLFGLREALMIQNKADDARQINLQFESAWKGGGSRPRLGEF